MGSESIAHEAKSWMGYWLKGHESEKNNNYYCFNKTQLVGQKTNFYKLKLAFNPFLHTKHYKYGQHFLLLVAIT